ncbi:hypothetical protein PUNSTDRAFT_139480 [Punctularia strigosozonata HHB-11173 SS5]|uniref:TPR-like protein n=1 Tax=Punctularia strigosozonata (strain HHB-11173) TaxID=741275 RepID=R7S0V6_PUNST|nr:uncharacterized protein PUNSTDRAFT_139480 [Punctularia strigosozonata HHB-11173 SS5]EIN03484.1 hypothetical protein PUNSTDRAFT_139480 [Punctularia strigosozonata HHB-11173 SS5]
MSIQTDERALAVMNTLATALVERYQRLSNIADLDKASRLCRSVSALTKKNDINHFQSIANLVVILTLTFEQTSDVVHLKDAVTLSKKALDCASPDHYIKALNNFAGVTFHLVKQTGRTELLDEARQHLLNAKKRASSATIEPADVAATISTLSVIHKTAFELLGILDDLNEAIKLSQQSLDLRPSGSPSRDIALNNHATILIMRYEKTGDPEDLRQAIDTYERTLALRPEGHPNRSVSLANLAVAITSRFRAQGSADDMDGALELLYQSLELTPAPHSRRPYSLMNIAVLLVSRYHQFQEARDLDECVRLLDQMGELCGEGHSLRVAYLSNLGSALELQYRRSSDLIYLKRGIRCLRDALRVCGPRDINKPTLLQNLGRQLRTLFQKNTDINILQESTRVLEDALTFYSTEHPRRPLALRNLARNYAIQGFRTGDKDWAVRARDLLLEALSLRDVGYPDRAEVMLEIVDLQLKFRPPGFPRDCGNELLVHALKDDACSPQIRLRLVNELLQRFHPPSVLAFCNTRDSLQQLVDIFSLATHLLPEVAFLGLDSQARLTALVGTESLGLEAAGYALCLPDCARAVELLEQSRAIFWSQALKLRSPLDDLPKDLRAEITEVCQWLERDSLTWSRESEASEPLATLTHKAALRRRQSEKLSNLFLRARDIPGLERFMLHERFDSLARAASSGPIIILLANKVACSGIMIKPSGQAVHVPLPQVTIERLGQLRKDWRKGLCKPKKQQKQFDVLEELWRNVVKPIIDALEFKARLSSPP